MELRKKWKKHDIELNSFSSSSYFTNGTGREYMSNVVSIPNNYPVGWHELLSVFCYHHNTKLLLQYQYESVGLLPYVQVPYAYNLLFLSRGINSLVHYKLVG